MSAAMSSEEAFEAAVSLQTEAYQFAQGPDGKWLFKCNDWLDIGAVLAAVAQPLPPPSPFISYPTVTAED